MKLNKMASQLLIINEDLTSRTKESDGEYEVYDFDQLWGSTALGFPGIGGSAMVTERTYVILNGKIAYVYFGSQFAYFVPVNIALLDDIKNQRMASVMGSGRYKKHES